MTATTDEQPARRAPVRDWLELARLSNVPTVLTNALVGVGIGVVATRADDGAAAIVWDAGSVGRVVAVSVALLLAYAAGMILNDVADAKIDATERPDRPIPSGRISRRAAGIATGLLLAIGLALVAVAGVAATCVFVLLIAAIVAYNMLHKRHGGSLVLMGVCRALVYAGPALAVAEFNVDLARALVPIGLAAIAYTTALTFTARDEATPDADAPHRPSPGAWLAFACAVLAPFAAARWYLAAGLASASWPTVAAAGLLIIAFALSGRRLATQPRPRAVLLLIASFCLIDAMYLALFGLPVLAGVCGLCFVITVLAHRRIMGT